MVVHFVFQIMVGIGAFLAGLSALYFLFVMKNPRLLFHSLYLKGLAFAIPLGFIAVEAGWVVTEVGRQPWIIYQVMKVSEAVTPMPGLIFPFILITGIYIFLSYVAAWLLFRQIKAVKT
jgi:cytochrome d ubiquinol oxidase subunit I